VDRNPPTDNGPSSGPSNLEFLKAPQNGIYKIHVFVIVPSKPHLQYLVSNENLVSPATTIDAVLVSAV
jgi:hypothetical protein